MSTTGIPQMKGSVRSMRSHRASSLRLRMLGTSNLPRRATSYMTVELPTGQSRSRRL